jgi:aryl-alcohol dehydrogenase-like predicted oxidoreductase
MRFSEKNLSAAAIRSLIAYAHERGVTTHHVSAEYASFASYCEALRSFPKAFRDGLAIIAKLPCPHFKDADPDIGLLRRRVDEYLESLGIDRIAVVQWLFRSEPLDDAVRIPLLEARAADLQSGFRELIGAGKAGEISAFPYTVAFMRHVSRLGLASSQVNYLNLLETEYAEFLEAGSFIAIRPLAAGKLGGRAGVDADPAWLPGALSDGANDGADSLPGLALNFPLWHPNVASVILGMNSRANVDDALCLLRPREDIARFNRTLEVLRSRQPAHGTQAERATL